MTMGWDSDFSYSYFKKMLRVAKDRFELHTLSEAPKIIGKNGKPKLILRHDVDVSLKRALEMAKIISDNKAFLEHLLISGKFDYVVRDLFRIKEDILERYDVKEKNLAKEIAKLAHLKRK